MNSYKLVTIPTSSEPADDSEQVFFDATDDEAAKAEAQRLVDKMDDPSEYLSPTENAAFPATLADLYLGDRLIWRNYQTLDGDVIRRVRSKEYEPLLAAVPDEKVRDALREVINRLMRTEALVVDFMTEFDDITDFMGAPSSGSAREGMLQHFGLKAPEYSDEQE
jgi:hypothetical protein